jgi:hypothetical protein
LVQEKKLTLQDISLPKQKGPKGAPHEEVLAEKQIAIPNDKSNVDPYHELEEDLQKHLKKIPEKGVSKNKKLRT